MVVVVVGACRRAQDGCGGRVRGAWCGAVSRKRCDRDAADEEASERREEARRVVGAVVREVWSGQEGAGGLVCARQCYLVLWCVPTPADVCVAQATGGRSDIKTACPAARRALSAAPEPSSWKLSAKGEAQSQCEVLHCPRQHPTAHELRRRPLKPRPSWPWIRPPTPARARAPTRASHGPLACPGPPPHACRC